MIETIWRKLSFIIYQLSSKKYCEVKIKKFEFNMFPVNCYVLSDETGEAVVIDPGCFYEEEKQLLKHYLTSHGLTLKRVLNTHLHLDHIFGNPFLFEEYGIQPEAGQQDEFWLAQASAQSRMFGFRYDEKQPAIGHYLCDGDIIRFGNTELETVHVPGHSPGSMVFVNRKDNCAFSGDVLFQGSIRHRAKESVFFMRHLLSACHTERSFSFQNASAADSWSPAAQRSAGTKW